jgi:hypothetical protein
MTPTTVGAFVGFAIFVVPGLCWELLRERKLPALRGSAFREAARVALTSGLFSLVGLAGAPSPTISFRNGYRPSRNG